MAVRTAPPSRMADGYEDAFLSSPDFLITAKQIEARRSFHDDEPGLGRLVFVFHLAGSREVELDRTERHRLSRPTFAAYYQAEGVSKRSVWQRGDRESAVVVGFWPKRPPRMLRSPLSRMPDWPAISSGARPCVWVERPLTFAMEQAARHILAPKVCPELLQHFLTIKASELLCLGVDAILRGRPETEDAAAALRGRILHAQSVIESALRQPPTAAQLGEIVGLPADAFPAAFRGITGLTLSQYVARMRMLKARQLLESTALPLKQIAYELGYNHTSNLCLAFKRHFGITARQARRPGQGVEARGLH